MTWWQGFLAGWAGCLVVWALVLWSAVHYQGQLLRWLMKRVTAAPAMKPSDRLNPGGGNPGTGSDANLTP